MVSRQDGFTVVGVKSDRRETVDDLQALDPDVAVVDMTMPESYATVRDLKQAAPRLPVVALAGRGPARAWRQGLPAT
jgi:DNA-binding NarL/FixJ family response regulator